MGSIAGGAWVSECGRWMVTPVAALGETIWHVWDGTTRVRDEQTGQHVSFRRREDAVAFAGRLANEPVRV